MGKTSSRLTAALDAVGARLKREGKHRVYALPGGQTFVTAKTPSDNRAELNALSTLRRVSGVDIREIVPPVVPVDGGDFDVAASERALNQAMKRAGEVERTLRVELATRDQRIAQLETQLSDIEDTMSDKTTTDIMESYRVIQDVARERHTALLQEVADLEIAFPALCSDEAVAQAVVGRQRRPWSDAAREKQAARLRARWAAKNGNGAAHEELSPLAGEARR